MTRGPSRSEVTFQQLAERPFEPIVERSLYEPPTATIDPDASKRWLARVWPIVRTHRGIWFISLGMSFIALVAQVQIPLVLGNAISKALPFSGESTAHPLEALRSIALFALGLIVLRQLTNYVGRRCLLTVAYRIEYDLRHAVYQHYMNLSFPFYDRVSVGQLISRANSDVRSVQMYLVMAPTIFLQCGVLVVAFVEMATINVPLTLIVGVSLPLTALVGVVMRRQLFPVSWLIQARLADVATLVEENIEGVRVVKSFANEQEELDKLGRSATKLQWAYVKIAYLRGRWAPTIENLPRFGLAAVLLYGGVLVIHSRLGIGTLYTFQAWMVLFQPPFRQLGMVITNGQRAAASAQRIFEVLDHKTEIVNAPDAIDLREPVGKVEFRNVEFSYSDGTAVLHDFNLTLVPGETVAVVGRTGSGKSTLGRLINRSYEVSGGSVTIDGIDVNRYTLESLRHNIGFVFDEPFLFSVSIRDNIAYGRPDASIDDVVAAAVAADADEFIVRLPDGYDTVVGERGYTLSGGQRQRLAIARTLLVNPPVLVLDDATSAIDVQVEQRIHHSLGELMAHRTTLIIAHRLATISLADR
ncbi:MAG TPA: ABC transporter ATP-binding protein, partial [Acidimicrobiales bacterium]|nr:ABC transporter ATP-binding protein [Acidimicrobiales bacterium]